MKKMLAMAFSVLVIVFQADSQVTQLVANINPPGGLSVNDKFAVTINSADGSIYVTDGSVPGSHLLTTAVSFQSEPQAGVIKGKIVFNGYDAAHGTELWISDGTDTGTHMLMDIYPGTTSSNPSGNRQGFYVVEHKILFVATTPGEGRELWVTNGTTAGTHMIKDITPGAASSNVTLSKTTLNNYLGNYVYFTANDGTNGQELWKTDGTDVNTVMVKNITTGAGSTSFADLFVAMDPYLYFPANNGVSGTELWRTNGTDTGTIMVKDIVPGAGSAFVNTNESGGISWGYLVFNNMLYFNTGSQLWQTNGFNAGTQPLQNVYANLLGFGSDDNPVIIGNKFYFIGNGSQLWQCDGTSIGTYAIKSFASTPFSRSAQILLPAVSNADVVFQHPLLSNRFFMIADDGVHGYEPWISDGSFAGTYMIKDVNPGGSSFDTSNNKDGMQYFLSEDKLYVSLNNGTSGFEPWQTDGTAAGTIQIADINSGANSSDANFVGLADSSILIFGANDGVGGSDWYKINSFVNPLLLTIYEFGGNGNWSNATNWANNAIPPNPLPKGLHIYINPPPGSECILDVPVTVKQGARITVKTGAKFKILSNLEIF